MSGPDRPAKPKRAVRNGRNIIRGLLLLGRGRAEGFECFEGDRDAFLAGLSPPIGFLLVLAALLLMQRPTLPAVILLLALVCAVLLPPVISHTMARLWKRSEFWPRYATASLWSVWLILPAYLPAMLLTAILLQMGVSHAVAGRLIVLLLGAYLLWLQWFMAWKGLSISRLKAGVTVLALTVGSMLVGTLMQPLLPLVMAP